MGKFMLLLFALPVVDLYGLLRLRHVFGGQPLLLAVIASALLGFLVARVKGMSELRAWRAALAEGRTPDRGVVDGLLLLLACGWLIVPGFLSDVLGLVLLIGPVRSWVGERLVARVREAVEQGSLQLNMQQMPMGGPFAAPGWQRQQSPWPQTQARDSRNVIDVEGEVVDSKPVEGQGPVVRKHLPS